MPGENFPSFFTLRRRRKRRRKRPLFYFRPFTHPHATFLRIGREEEEDAKAGKEEIGLQVEGKKNFACLASSRVLTMVRVVRDTVLYVHTRWGQTTLFLYEAILGVLCGNTNVANCNIEGYTLAKLYLPRFSIKNFFRAPFSKKV